ncbi:hypothetical protein, partial [Dysosmobacter sp.]|uniref:hypothetical protein n=1 Tax=Dysosmobacter sp. TaxID=2591382 RepID=UPI003A941111
MIFAQRPRPPRTITAALFAETEGLLVLFHARCFILPDYRITIFSFVKAVFAKNLTYKSQALNAHNFSLLVLSNFDKSTWPPSCPMVGSLRVFLFCSPCSAPL